MLGNSLAVWATVAGDGRKIHTAYGTVSEKLFNSISYHTLLNFVRQGGADEMGKSGYGTSPRLHTANAPQSRAGAAREAGEAASGILTLQWWGPEPGGKIHSCVTPRSWPSFLISLRS